MSLESIPIDALVERATQYARERANGAAIANWITGVAYSSSEIVSLGDGRYVIGYLTEMGWAKRRGGDSEHYPIIFSPDTQRLQVKLPKAVREP